jgi:hypothetical protein
MASDPQSSVRQFLAFGTQLVHAISEWKSLERAEVEISLSTLSEKLEPSALTLQEASKWSDRDSKQLAFAIRASVVLANDLRFRFETFQHQISGLGDEQNFQTVLSLVWSRTNRKALEKGLSIIRVALERYCNRILVLIP